MKPRSLMTLAAAGVAIATIAVLSLREEPAAVVADVAEPRVLYWYDPMHPGQHFDAPGRSPFMDMDLVPRYASDTTDAVEVVIDPRMAQNLGLRTAPVVRGTFYQRIDTSGRVEVDERSRVEVLARAPGWVEVLAVRAQGEPVHKGQILAEIYSPVIATAAGEFAVAVKSGRSELITAARAKLAALAVDPVVIDRIEATGDVPQRQVVVSPIEGFIMKLGVRLGGAVAIDSPMFELSDHQSVWIMAEVPERGIGLGGCRSRRGGPSYRDRRSSVRRRRGLCLPGPRSRHTHAARSHRAEERDDHLHPGMYAEVTLFGGGQPESLLVPTEAVIRTGERTMVMVAKGSGHYAPAIIRIGAERRGQTVVLEGLDAGDEVVTSGQFLIDSEASLQGAYRRLHGSMP
ncbi:MAG: efflux RND transporter periplasmic adaptor subunit [Gammaproteobacteria bacterium]|nr:efflux RND transporter periplasmic adaptor subunit [Gammaproteobacteria bacterium]